MVIFIALQLIVVIFDDVNDLFSDILALFLDFAGLDIVLFSFLFFEKA